MRAATSEILLAWVTFSLVGISALGRETVVSSWPDQQAKLSIEHILKNIQYTQEKLGGSPGALVASPGSAFDNVNGEQQDYQYHWVRDAAIVMRVVFDLYLASTDVTVKAKYKKILLDYADFCAKNQTTETRGGLGEPKFFVNGNAFNNDWGRPQNDGPALRAITLSAVAEQLIANGEIEKAKAIFVTIKKDLDYVAEVHTHPSFDIWEENLGIHFATLNFQQAALTNGAHLASLLRKQNESYVAKWQSERANIRRRMRDFWRDNDGFIEASQGIIGGHVTDKTSNLDSAVIMSVLYVQNSLSAQDEGAIRPTNSWVLATAEKLRAKFEKLYPLNQNRGFFAGRYPEDRYFGGNPWAIPTFDFANLYLQVGHDFAKAGSIRIDDQNRDFLKRVLPAREQYIVQTNRTLGANSSEFAILIKNLTREGNAILEGVKDHIPANGEISEQFSKIDGRPVALPNLNWSHAEFIRAYQAHEPVTTKTCIENLKP